MTKRAARDAIYRGRRFPVETIELCVRWYITCRLSYRDLVAMMAEQGIVVSHLTIMRWVLHYVPEYERRWVRYARSPGTSWRMDETAVAVRAAGTTCTGRLIGAESAWSSRTTGLSSSVARRCWD